MKVRTLAWILGTTFLFCGGAAGIVACSDDSKTGELPSTPDGGGSKDATVDRGAPGPDGTAPGDDSGAGDGGVADANARECGPASSNPALRTSDTLGVYCPFREAGTITPTDGGDAGRAPLNCQTGEVCCVYARNANRESACLPSGSQCATVDAGETRWECGESNDCTGGGACCFAGEPVESTECPGDNFARGAKGTTCRARPGDGGAACRAGEVEVCSKSDASACPSGTTCTAFASRGIDLGWCK